MLLNVPLPSPGHRDRPVKFLSTVRRFPKFIDKSGENRRTLDVSGQEKSAEKEASATATRFSATRVASVT